MRPGSARPRPPRRAQRGYTYVMVLTVLALLGLSLATLGPLWAEDTRREQERELLRIGAAYATAIRAYYEAAPGSLRRHPPDLQSLLQDDRYVGVRRHLRRLERDPLDPHRPWGLVRAADGGVAGVYSQDERTPLLRTPTEAGPVSLPVAGRYADWKFAPKVAP